VRVLTSPVHVGAAQHNVWEAVCCAVVEVAFANELRDAVGRDREAQISFCGWKLPLVLVRQPRWGAKRTPSTPCRTQFSSSLTVPSMMTSASKVGSYQTPNVRLSTLVAQHFWPEVSKTSAQPVRMFIW
jgi:hypothetical protein